MADVVDGPAGVHERLRLGVAVPRDGRDGHHGEAGAVALDHVAVVDSLKYFHILCLNMF